MRTMPAENVEALRPRLKEAQKALEAALEEACDTDVVDADSGELLRLEESLAVAREAARNAIDVLQRLNRERLEEDKPSSERHRFFVDDSGVEWDAFPVYPSRAHLPAPFNEGWLSVQCANEIRRLTPIPEGWRDLPREKLCQLLQSAPSARRRAALRAAKAENPENSAQA